MNDNASIVILLTSLAIILGLVIVMCVYLDRRHERYMAEKGYLWQSAPSNESVMQYVKVEKEQKP